MLRTSMRSSSRSPEEAKRITRDLARQIQSVRNDSFMNPSPFSKKRDSVNVIVFPFDERRNSINYKERTPVARSLLGTEKINII